MDGKVLGQVCPPINYTHSVIRILAKLFIGSLLIVGSGFAAESPVRQYDIPAQSLNNALVQFAADTNLELIFSADMLRGLEAKAISGELTQEEVLHRLLFNTGYTFRLMEGHTVTIIPATNHKESNSEQVSQETSGRPAHIEVLLPMTVIGEDSIYTSLSSPKSYRVTHGSGSTRTLTPIKETPQSIQIVPRSVINDQQNLNLSESLRNVSGVVTDHISLTPSFDSTLIRGFRAEQLLDGFTQYYNAGDRESLINIDRIEVLKGTNALLYGGGSGSPAGGLVNIVSKLPHSQAHYELGFTLGSYQYYQPYLDLNQPVNEHVLFRITGEYTHSESYIDTLKTERYNINPSLILTNNKDTSLTLQAKVSNWQQPDYQGLPATGTVSGDFDIRPETYIGPQGIENSQAEFYGAWGALEHALNETWSFSFKARYTQSQFDQKVQAIFGNDGFKANEPLLLPSTWALSNTQLFQEQDEVSLVFNAIARFRLGPTDNVVLIGADYSQLNDQGFIDFGTEVTGYVDLNAEYKQDI